MKSCKHVKFTCGSPNCSVDGWRAGGSESRMHQMESLSNTSFENGWLAFREVVFAVGIVLPIFDWVVQIKNKKLLQWLPFCLVQSRATLLVLNKVSFTYLDYCFILFFRPADYFL